MPGLQESGFPRPSPQAPSINIPHLQTSYELLVPTSHRKPAPRTQAVLTQNPQVVKTLADLRADPNQRLGRSFWISTDPWFPHQRSTGGHFGETVRSGAFKQLLCGGSWSTFKCLHQVPMSPMTALIGSHFEQHVDLC